MMLDEVRFYHLQRQPLDAALPKLLERVLERGMRTVVKVPGPDLLEKLDRALWEYEPASFLPHGTADDGHKDRQPIYLTTGDERPNDADIVLLINAVSAPKDMTGVKMCLYMFDGHDTDIVARARQDWLAFKDKAENLSYWQQKSEGGWEQKA